MESLLHGEIGGPSGEPKRGIIPSPQRLKKVPVQQARL